MASIFDKLVDPYMKSKKGKKEKNPGRDHAEETTQEIHRRAEAGLKSADIPAFKTEKKRKKDE